jgi:hypothetical protein
VASDPAIQPDNPQLAKVWPMHMPARCLECPALQAAVPRLIPWLQESFTSSKMNADLEGAKWLQDVPKQDNLVVHDGTMPVMPMSELAPAPVECVHAPRQHQHVRTAAPAEGATKTCTLPHSACASLPHLY